MKSITITLFMILSIHGWAQEPQKVYSIVDERREMSWYQEQEKLWKQEIDENQKNANAWFNYYEAVRAQSILSWENKEEKEKLDKKLSTIISELNQTIPNTFENNLLQYRNEGALGDGSETFKYLEKAYQIDPLDPRTYVLMITHHYVERNHEEFKKFCEKFYKANNVAPFIYNLNYNILSELDSNAIIFTAGDNDTYPAWVLQEVLNYRQDVKVLNTSLLNLDSFRDKILKEIGLPPFEDRLNECKSQEEFKEKTYKMYEHILDNSKSIPVYVSMTAIRQFQSEFEDDLYLTGLTYKYSKESIDNIALLKRNHEKRHKLDRTEQLFSYHIQNNKLAEVNSIYLPGLIKLFKHYRDSEDIAKMNELKKLLDIMSKDTYQREEIEKLIKD